MLLFIGGVFLVTGEDHIAGILIMLHVLFQD